MRHRKPALLSLLLLLASALCAQSLERAEALWKAGDYEGANDAFRALVAAHPKNPDYRVRWGRLFLERFQPADAGKLFQEALDLKKDHTGALIGLARVASEDFEQKAVQLAERALAVDPKLVEAHELLARLALEDSNPAKAAEHARQAGDSEEARAILASIDWLAGRDTAHTLSARGYATVGRLFVLNRRYEEGIDYYRKAVELDPKLWPAHSQLGINLMRLGDETGARRHLELCYDNRHRDSATVNTLRLMDSYKNFVTVQSGNVILKLHKKEAALLRPYVEAELKRAMAAYDKKYAFKLERPVQLELYPDHEDFAVRTLGMPGLGALGVSFGYVVAMDSPSGRKPGTFHWASTLWHELSHVYVLAATRHRVPRWFTEGMAVYEETAASPEWGDRLDQHTIQAIKDKKLLPITQLDRGFVRPTYPSQVPVSYFQAGRVCSYIAKHWGYDKLLAMMRDFAALEPTGRVVEKELAISPEEFDKRFFAAVEAETKAVVDGFDEWRKRVRHVAELAQAGKHDEVIREAPAVRDLYPDYIEAANPYEFLADAYIAKGDKPAAIAELERYAKAGGRSPGALKRLASLLEEAGRKQDAAVALERLIYIHPLDEELHRRLGDLWMALGDSSRAVREYRALTAMGPSDPAAAHFQLAQALTHAKRLEEAKDELLNALEVAPGYRPAQKLLLEISRK